LHRFWNLALQPLVEAAAPRRILEIGSEAGENTRRLLTWAAARGAVVESVDPDPQFNVEEWEAVFAPHFVFHRKLSLEAMPDIEAVDLALIDGDHNWYTVINELRLLDRGDGPVVALHDIDWPYGRRDLYYLPETIPAQYRQDYARQSVLPGEDSLGTGGLNAHLRNARSAGGARNGVRTAVEDFCAESDREWVFFDLPGLHGLGIIAPRERLDSNRALAAILTELDRPTRLRELTQRVEEQRLWTEIRLAQARERVEERDEQLGTLRSERGRLIDDLARERSQGRAERQRHARELAAVNRQLEYEQAVREEARVLAHRVGESASWRWGHRVFSLLRAVTFRSNRGTDAVRRLERRLEGVGGPSPAPAGDGTPARRVPVARVSGGERGWAASSASELIARQHFLTKLADLTPEGNAVDGLLDPLAAPETVDRRGLLVDRHDASSASAGPTVDVVVCVHNALEDVRRCLWSLAARATHPFHLLVVDDGSDAATAALLDEVAAANPTIELVREPGPARGYTVAANLGLARSTGDYVVLLNSDTVVTTGWIEGLLACGESDQLIGVLGPLSNAAGHQSLPRLRADNGAWAANELPACLTEEGMAALLRRISRHQRPRFPFINGFCYVIRRPVLDAIGVFDEEHFPEGYCEENDFSYRALQAGFDLAVADDVYVFHAKSRSYSEAGRNARAKPNYQVFLEKHGRAEIQGLVSGLEDNLALQPLRDAVEEVSDSPLHAGDLIVGPDPLRVTFILPGLSRGGSGGSHSIYQEVCGMREIGVPANVALPAPAFEAAQWAYKDAAEVFEPFADLAELESVTAGSQVIVATHFKSVAMLAHLRSAREDFLPAYYIQDYEPFIVLDDHPDHDEALDSYAAVPDALLFAKTHWLCNVVGHAHGLQVAKVEPSIDSALFRPGHRQPDGPVRVAGMVRPRTPRRQPAGTVAILERLRRDHGDAVQTITFGCEIDELMAITDDRATLEAHRGTLKRRQVAELLGQVDIFLDLSTYQAFGRTALEAMSCGCATIVPRLGGAAEFAIHDHNSLVVDTSDQVATYDALASLAVDTPRLRAVQSAALQTAARYSVLRASISEYVLFHNEYSRRIGTVRELDSPRAAR
jgi:GT2 family glycosyltransferase